MIGRGTVAGIKENRRKGEAEGDVHESSGPMTSSEGSANEEDTCA